MQLSNLPRRTVFLFAVMLFALIGIASLSPRPMSLIVVIGPVLGGIVLAGIALMPDVRGALQARLDTRAGGIVCILATSVFLFAAVTCATTWWLLAPWSPELQRPVMTGHHVAILRGSALALVITGPIAWRWLAFRLLSRPVSSLPFLRTSSAAMRLLLVLSIAFLVLVPRLYDAIQPWLEQPSFWWLKGMLKLVHWGLGSVVVLGFLSGVSQLLQRCFGTRPDPEVPR